MLAPCLSALLALTAATCARAAGAEAVFHEMVETVRESFYDPAAAQAWAEDVLADDALLADLHAADTNAEWGPLAREALSRLNASHTTLYTPADARYAQLLDIFRYDDPPEETAHVFPAGVIETETIGVITTEIAGRTFVRTALAGSPAAAAGVRRGDELLSDEVAAVAGRAEQPTTVRIRRHQNADPIELEIAPEKIKPRAMFLRAITAGADVIQNEETRIAYIPVPSYAGPWFHEAVKDSLWAEPLRSCDALILDIRTGWGGANPQYLDLFNPAAPSMDFKFRAAGEWSHYTTTWTKPVALVVDSDTRSGKEMLAFAFRKHDLGVVVGERTAGAVLAGSLRILSDGSALYVAVGDAAIDGVRLEGAGVMPDVEVAPAIPYANGRDPILARASDLLLDLCRQRADSSD